MGLCSNSCFALFLYNYYLFINTKICGMMAESVGPTGHDVEARGGGWRGADLVCQHEVKPW